MEYGVHFEDLGIFSPSRNQLRGIRAKLLPFTFEI